MTEPETFPLRGDHIALDALIKACGAAPSGGEAKRLIVGGAVRVNEQAEARRGRKLRAGDRVTVGDRCIVVSAQEPDRDSRLGL